MPAAADRPAADGDTSPSYEAARDELVEVVRRLEQGGATLEESLALWERGEELARVCQDRLDGAQARLDGALHTGGLEHSGESGSGPDAAGEDQ